MYVLITKQTCKWRQAAEPADLTCFPNLLLKMLFSVLVMRADFKDTAFSCLLSDWSLDGEGVFSLTTATGVGDVSELPVNRQRFGSVTVPWRRVQLLLLAAVWSDIDWPMAGGESFHRRSQEEEIFWVAQAWKQCHEKKHELPRSSVRESREPRHPAVPTAGYRQPLCLSPPSWEQHVGTGGECVWRLDGFSKIFAITGRWWFPTEGNLELLCYVVDWLLKEHHG